MEELRQRLKDMKTKLKDKLSEIAEKTANISNHITVGGTSDGNKQVLYYSNTLAN